MSEQEQSLAGGNVADQVVRVGATVRKPWHEGSESIGGFLAHLQHVGFAAAPRWLGRDQQGRQMIEYIPGETIAAPEMLSLSELQRTGALVCQLHEASRAFVPPADAHWNTAIAPDAAEMICHHDLAPWNLVRDGQRWVFIDWDAVGPGSAMWDLAWAALTFTPLNGTGEPSEDANRLRSFVHGYGLAPELRGVLPEKMSQRARAMIDLLEDGARTGAEPWARLHGEGHADYWRRSAEYIEAHADVWLRALTRGLP